jgi:hypothetical protein
VASASRIAAIEPLKSSLTTAALGGAQIKEILLTELCKTLAEILPQKARAADPLSTVACNSVGRSAVCALKIRGIAPHRAGWKVSLEMGRSTSPPRIELA